MSRCCSLAVSFFLLVTAAFADDSALWREYGLVHSTTTQQGKLTATTYQMKDPTGALAAWESLRNANTKPCALAPFCSSEENRLVVSDYNYVIVFTGGTPTKPEVAALFNGLPNKRDTSLPAILTFLPRQGLVPGSARYVLGPVSLSDFAPELASIKPGFDTGAEAQVAEYRVGKTGAPARLAIFYYPAPEMARIHAADFNRLSNVRVKRSDVLLAVVLSPASSELSDTLLSRVQYEAKITWNDVPPPSPIKPLYRLLVNILYLSAVLTALCLFAGLIYAGMRLYRRRYGALDSEESMTTLHLT